MTTKSISGQKESHNHGRKGSNDSQQTDWVCTNCFNLNFSFRRKCNRCKVQSREQNDRSLQSYYEYENYYRQEAKTLPVIELASTPKKGKEKAFFTQKKIESSDELPSVSPLVKKYRARKDRQDKKTVDSDTKSIFSHDSWGTFCSSQDQAKPNEETSDNEQGSAALLTILNRIII